MKVYSTDDFHGHYPVGAAAIVVAESEEKAFEYLDAQLRLIGLNANGATFKEIDVTSPSVNILVDGDY